MASWVSRGEVNKIIDYIDDEIKFYEDRVNDEGKIDLLIEIKNKLEEL